MSKTPGQVAYELTPTARGFLRADFKDGNGVDCSIQESSAAEQPYLWLGCNNPNPMSFPGNGTGWHPYSLPDNVQCTTRMHLTQEQASALIPLLQRFIEQGDLSECEAEDRAVESAARAVQEQAAEKIDELECTLEDEEVAHAETLRMLDASRLAFNEQAQKLATAERTLKVLGTLLDEAGVLDAGSVETRTGRLIQQRDKASARVTELEKAIGVMVPCILRCFIAETESETDRDVAQKVLARVDKAMESRKPPDPLYGAIAEASEDWKLATERDQLDSDRAELVAMLGIMWVGSFSLASPASSPRPAS